MKLKTNSLAHLAAGAPDEALKKRCQLLISELVDNELSNELTKGSHRKVEWSCAALNHRWAAEVCNRIKGQGCPYCSNRWVLAGFNDIATTHPEIASELANPAVGRSITAGSEPDQTWICSSVGHRYDASPRHRTGANSGCPICAGKIVLPGFNDIATTHAHLAAELLEPSDAKELTAFSRKIVDWRCKACSRVFSSKVQNRTAGNTGCPACAKSGFDPNSQATLYVLQAEKDGNVFIKVGITNTGGVRLDRLKRCGFTPRCEILLVGSKAQAIEKALLGELRKSFGQPVGKPHFDSVFPKAPGGHTETWVEQTGMYELITAKLKEALAET